MKWKRKKLFSVIILLTLLAPAMAMAHFGGKDKAGGHVCRKNCEEYNLEYGQYHLHKPGSFTVLTEPESKPEKPSGAKNSSQDLNNFFYTFLSGFILIAFFLLLWLFDTIPLIAGLIVDFFCEFISDFFKKIFRRKGKGERAQIKNNGE